MVLLLPRPEISYLYNDIGITPGSTPAHWNALVVAHGVVELPGIICPSRDLQSLRRTMKDTHASTEVRILLQQCLACCLISCKLLLVVVLEIHEDGDLDRDAVDVLDEGHTIQEAASSPSM